jgi:hypothetical protein
MSNLKCVLVRLIDVHPINGRVLVPTLPCLCQSFRQALECSRKECYGAESQDLSSNFGGFEYLYSNSLDV